jgi:hypothetical protein
MARVSLAAHLTTVSLTEQFKDKIHSDAKAPDSRSALTNLWIDFHTIKHGS